MNRKLLPDVVRVALLGSVMALTDLLLPAGTLRDLLVLCADAVIGAVALRPRPLHHRAPRPWRAAARARVRRSCSGRGPEHTGVEQ
ncbi:hypothetical protein [Streptomyces monomycini]|uniref:hypothetical protein n=1 Tax=Streptomyces monomycini TaxID=371720 RepID=UPI0004ABAF5C|nr:hypothetical protein [Streptomyces monomycini]